MNFKCAKEFHFRLKLRYLHKDVLEVLDWRCCAMQYHSVHDWLWRQKYLQNLCTRKRMALGKMMMLPCTNRWVFSLKRYWFISKWIFHYHYSEILRIGILLVIEMHHLSAKYSMIIPCPLYREQGIPSEKSAVLVRQLNANLGGTRGFLCI